MGGAGEAAPSPGLAPPASPSAVEPAGAATEASVGTTAAANTRRWPPLPPWRLSLSLVGLAVLLWAGSHPARWLGFVRPVTWLVLIQNSAELRASGGFITLVGEVRLDRGRLTTRVQKVYDAEGVAAVGPHPPPTGVYIQPPAPLRRYMGLGEWRLRDANWSPDFPTVARQAARFWAGLDRGDVDGVVAVDDAALAAVIDALGGVQLTDGERLQGDNLVALAIGRSFAEPTEAAQHAEQAHFAQDLADSLRRALWADAPARWPAVIQVLAGAVARHDLLIAPFDADLAALSRRLGADGALSVPDADFFYLDEQNVSYAKLSRFIARDLAYEIQLDAAGRPTQARLTVRTSNSYSPGQGYAAYPTSYYDGARWLADEGRLDARQGDYGGFTRLFLPAGSRLTAAEGFAEPPTAEPAPDLTGIGGYVGLDQGAWHDLQFAWVPRPIGAGDGTYRLRLRRQPGAPTWIVAVHVVPPPGFAVAPVDAGETLPDGSLHWLARLDQDVTLRARLVPRGADQHEPAATSG